MKSKLQEDKNAPVRRAAGRPAAGEGAGPSAEDAWEEFAAFLRTLGDRVTQARRFVLEAVFARDDHFRADELAADLSGGPGRVSRGTIYRTLALLVDAGFVRRIRDGDLHVHYENVYGRAHHEHMICEKCGRFIEFEEAQIGELIEKACRKRGFAQHAHRVVVFGICRDCKSREGGQTGNDRQSRRSREVE